MKKISESLNDIVKENPFLGYGLNNHLFNLSNLTRFLKPLIEVRTKKSVTEASVLMSLSRLARSKAKTRKDNFKINNLTVHYNLFSATFIKSEKNQAFVNKIYSLAHEKNSYLTISYGQGEITIIADEFYLPLVRKEKISEPKSLKPDLVSMGVQFSPDYAVAPGFIFYLMAQIALQNINICEVSSTFTELIFYLHKSDAKIAFETLSLLLK
jgi:hypothetical protein